jgi:hypothetical protein
VLIALTFSKLAVVVFVTTECRGYLRLSTVRPWFYFTWRNSPQWARASSFMRFLDHTQKLTTVGRTPLEKWSAHCRNLYLTTHNTHNRQTSIPTISAGKPPQTYALDRTATGTGRPWYSPVYFTPFCFIPLDNVHHSLIDSCYIFSLTSFGWLHASPLVRTHETHP